MIPTELADVVARDGAPLERIRAAILEVQSCGASVTGRSVRAVAKVDANVVDRVVRLFKAGSMPPVTEAWGPAPRPTRTTRLVPPTVPGPGDPPPAPPVGRGCAPQSELADEIQAADTVSKLEEVGRRVTVAILEGEVEPRVGDLVIAGLREQRQAMKMRMLERQEQAVAAIEVLTPEEVALLAAHRAARAPRPLQPGEAAPPP